MTTFPVSIRFVETDGPHYRHTTTQLVRGDEVRDVVHFNHVLTSEEQESFIDSLFRLNEEDR